MGFPFRRPPSFRKSCQAEVTIQDESVQTLGLDFEAELVG